MNSGFEAGLSVALAQKQATVVSRQSLRLVEELVLADFNLSGGVREFSGAHAVTERPFLFCQRVTTIRNVVGLQY